MKYINFEENRKIGQKVSLKKSDVIGYEKKMTSRAFATRAKNTISAQIECRRSIKIYKFLAPHNGPFWSVV